MVFGIILVSALALIAGLAAAVFQTESARSENVQDELKREKILDCLPGENCGVCGYSCCSDTALPRRWRLNEESWAGRIRCVHV